MILGLQELHPHPVNQRLIRPRAWNSELPIWYSSLVLHRSSVLPGLAMTLLPGGSTIISLPYNHPLTFTSGKPRHEEKHLAHNYEDGKWYVWKLNLSGGLVAQGELLPPKHTANLRGFSVPKVAMDSDLKLPGRSNGNERKEGKKTNARQKQNKTQKRVMGKKCRLANTKETEAKGTSRYSAQRKSALNLLNTRVR